MLRAAFVQQIAQVLKIFDVAPLVAGDRDALHVFLNGRVDDLKYRAVVAEVNDFRAGGLQNASHNIDRRIVAVEERSRRNEANFVLAGIACVIVFRGALAGGMQGSGGRGAE